MGSVRGAPCTDDSIFTTLQEKVEALRLTELLLEGREGCESVSGGGGTVAGNIAIEAGYPRTHATAVLPQWCVLDLFLPL